MLLPLRLLRLPKLPLPNKVNLSSDKTVFSFAGVYRFFCIFTPKNNSIWLYLPDASINFLEPRAG